MRARRAILGIVSIRIVDVSSPGQVGGPYVVGKRRVHLSCKAEHLSAYLP